PLGKALLSSATVACCFPDLPGVFTHVIPNTHGKLRQNVRMNAVDIEPSHVFGLEPLPFFVAEAMARCERLRVVPVQRQGLLGTEQLNQGTLQCLCTHIARPPCVLSVPCPGSRAPDLAGCLHHQLELTPLFVL